MWMVSSSLWKTKKMRAGSGGPGCSKAGPGAFLVPRNFRQAWIYSQTLVSKTRTEIQSREEFSPFPFCHLLEIWGIGLFMSLDWLLRFSNICSPNLISIFTGSHPRLQQVAEYLHLPSHLSPSVLSLLLCKSYWPYFTRGPQLDQWPTCWIYVSDISFYGCLFKLQFSRREAL